MKTKEYIEGHGIWTAWAADHLHRKWKEWGMPPSVYQRFMGNAALCESPIERKMLAGLLFCSFGYYDELNDIVSHEELTAGGVFGSCCAIIVPQAALFSYRVDFLVILDPMPVRVSSEKIKPPIFVIECDGHDFHERTKQQAARDRKRDRDMQAHGIPILRFTGSEIHNDLDRCIEEVSNFGSELLDKIAE